VASQEKLKNNLSEESNRIKRTMVSVITSLTRKSIEEAGVVPYVVEQDKLVDLLINNPDRYQDIVLGGKVDETVTGQGIMIVKEDILQELGEFKGLDAFDLSFDRMMDQESVRLPVFAQINSQCRMFAAYVSNMITIFEEEYANFLRRYRQALHAAGQELRLVKLDLEDLSDLEKAAKARMVDGKFLTAIAYDRLFNPEVMREQILQFPRSDYSLARRMIENAPKDVAFSTELIKFLVRACYISQNQWFDLLAILIELAEADPKRYRRSQLVHWIEQDSVFCCNLLQETYDSLRWWKAGQRKDAIENSLTRIARGEYSLADLKPKLEQ